MGIDVSAGMPKLEDFYSLIRYLKVEVIVNPA
jgi:hypothetical protein